jgi:hypothetical protein
MSETEKKQNDTVTRAVVQYYSTGVDIDTENLCYLDYSRVLPPMRLTQLIQFVSCHCIDSCQSIVVQ